MSESEAHHSIKAVSRRTGLSPHVIRIWEKRYAAVEPDRTGTNRRLYSEDQIERLELLRGLTKAGHSIGQVARLPKEKLRQLAGQAQGARKKVAGQTASAITSPFLEQCLDAIKKLDARSLEDTLKRASTALGSQGLLQRLIAPLAQTLGDLWRDGVITAAHEHFASVVIRIFLGHAAKPFIGSDEAPVIVVGTLSGQLHELGALLVGAAAANLGWHVIYLGPSLPAAEIAGAARQNNARAVALSFVYPEDDIRLPDELARLRELLPSDILIIAGGRAMPAYREALEKIGAIQMQNLNNLCDQLNELRKPTKKEDR